MSSIIVIDLGTTNSCVALMDGKNPQNWAIGVKELWQLPEQKLPNGYVAHTLGHPLGHSIFGGGWIYTMKNNILELGIVVGLDYKNPNIDPHHELQLLKSHPRELKTLPKPFWDTPKTSKTIENQWLLKVFGMAPEAVLRSPKLSQDLFQEP